MAQEIRILSESEARRHLDDLASVLVDCVAGGAGVGFILPFTQDDAREWWQALLPAVGRGERVLLAAVVDGRVMGTVQLVLASPVNQQHRADVAKMLVHSQARRRGIGEALLRALDDVARQHGKSLMTLDTVTGSGAERLYLRLGWTKVGSIPNYALSPTRTWDATTIMWKAV